MWINSRCSEGFFIPPHASDSECVNGGKCVKAVQPPPGRATGPIIDLLISGDLGMLGFECCVPCLPCRPTESTTEHFHLLVAKVNHGSADRETVNQL